MSSIVDKINKGLKDIQVSEDDKNKKVKGMKFPVDTIKDRSVIDHNLIPCDKYNTRDLIKIYNSDPEELRKVSKLVGNVMKMTKADHFSTLFKMLMRDENKLKDDFFYHDYLLPLAMGYFYNGMEDIYRENMKKCTRVAVYKHRYALIKVLGLDDYIVKLTFSDPRGLLISKDYIGEFARDTLMIFERIDCTGLGGREFF